MQLLSKMLVQPSAAPARAVKALERRIGAANEAAFLDHGHDGGFGVGEGRIGFGNRRPL